MPAGQPIGSREHLLDLVRQMRSGDETASQEFVELFEPHLRAAVRVRLSGGHLRRLFDSTDISQSVFRAFFTAVTRDNATPEEPAGSASTDSASTDSASTDSASAESEIAVQLERLLLSMARNKLVSHARAQMGVKRDLRRDVPLNQEQQIAAPSIAADKWDVRLIQLETLAQVKARLSTDEYELLSMRANGISWKTIAARIGVSAEAARKRAARAMDRMRREFEQYVS